MESGMIREVDLMCNLSGYVEEKGIRKGKTECLAALVRTLKPIYTEFSELYEAVVKNPEYADFTEEDVRKVF